MAIRIALAGNPNCGKTTMFNKLTGANQYVGNWPGVTVEKKEGKYLRDKTVTITDLPGIYSLSPYSPEEIVARDYLIDERPDCVVNLVDATSLERNLYLTTQIVNLGLPVVVALNMADLLEKNGDKIDLAKLSKTLGCPVVTTSALHNKGLDELLDEAIKAANAGVAAKPAFRFDAAVEDALAEIEKTLTATPDYLRRWYAIKLFEHEERAIATLKPGKDVLAKAKAVREGIESQFDDDAESIVTSERYDAIAHIVDETVKRSGKTLTATQKIDRIVTSRWLGLPIFILVMFIVYYVSISTVGTGATDWVNDSLFGDGFFISGGDGFEEATAAAEEAGAEAPDPSEFGTWVNGIPTVVTGALESVDAAPWLQSLIIDGIIAGVGAVLGFIPQMLVLFLFLAFLEGCGYMSRVAFVMDRIFRKFGLSGKSFIPMLIASGCGVPAVMSTQTIESEKDRHMTIMTTTMIPCSAKLPIIALVFGALAGAEDSTVWWVAPLFYFMGVTAIIVSGIMLRKTRLFAGEATPFVMELPQYHVPTVRFVLQSSWDRIKSYCIKAGTIIFLSTIVIWFLLNFGFGEGSFGLIDQETQMDSSLMAYLGKGLAWIFIPLGFGDWQATVTTVTGLVAKENVVATMGILTSLGSKVGETDPSLWSSFAAMFGGSAPAIMAFCAFNLLCAPCFAAIGTIWRQMGNAKWTWIAIGYMTGFAYVVGLIIYQLGMLLSGQGFGIGTVIAVIALAGILFQLFRPMPHFEDKKDEAVVENA